MSYDPMTAKTVEGKVWAEACSLQCWVPNPALGAPRWCGQPVAGSLLLYLFRDASSKQSNPTTGIHLHRARFHVTITSSGGDWCCALQLVSRLQRSYCRKVIRRLAAVANVQLHNVRACRLAPRLGFE